MYDQPGMDLGGGKGGDKGDTCLRRHNFEGTKFLNSDIDSANKMS